MSNFGKQDRKTTQAVEAQTRSRWTKLRRKTKRSNPERFVVAFNLWIQSMKQNCSWSFFGFSFFFSSFSSYEWLAHRPRCCVVYALGVYWRVGSQQYGRQHLSTKKLKQHLGHQTRQGRDGKKWFLKKLDLIVHTKSLWYVEENNIQSLLTIHSRTQDWGSCNAKIYILWTDLQPVVHVRNYEFEIHSQDGATYQSACETRIFFPREFERKLDTSNYIHNW